MLNFLKVFAILNKKIKNLYSINEDNTIEINKLKDKSILCAGINNAITIATAGENAITIDKEISKIGNKLIIDNGKIKINEDMKILVSAKVQMTLKSNSGIIKNIYVQKNGSTIIDLINEVYHPNDNWRMSVSGSELPISVAKNDVIELKGYFGVGDIIQSQDSRTYITIKEV